MGDVGGKKEKKKSRKEKWSTPGRQAINVVAFQERESRATFRSWWK
jgi:hypothetical protein